MCKIASAAAACRSAPVTKPSRIETAAVEFAARFTSRNAARISSHAEWLARARIEALRQSPAWASSLRRGTIQQYAGRLHRLYATKKVVQIYDYVDSAVPVLARMYKRRLKGYSAIGYAIQP